MDFEKITNRIIFENEVKSFVGSFIMYADKNIIFLPNF